MKKSNSIVSRIAILALLSAVALVATAPVAEADTCPGSTVFGVACNTCYNPGTQFCCPGGQLVAAGTQCPIAPSQPRPVAPSATGQSQHSPGNSSAVVVRGSGCIGTWRCPSISQITITRTPIPPAGWTVGQTSTARATALDEGHDSEIDTSKPDGLLTCHYGEGAAVASVTMKRNTNGMTCDGIGAGAASTNGFCCR
jgi:hypothetical protein